MAKANPSKIGTNAADAATPEVTPAATPEVTPDAGTSEVELHPVSGTPKPADGKGFTWAPTARGAWIKVVKS